MSDKLYSVEQVSEQLGLHVRTIRGYVREGRLKAVRIGKQYRITAEDLAAMTGRPAASFEPEPVRRYRHVEVSSIVEIDGISPDSASRVTNMLLASTSGRRENDEPLRIEFIYNEQRGHLKVILLGSLETNASMLKLIGVLTQS